MPFMRWGVLLIGLAGCRGLLGFEEVEIESSIRFELTRINVENDAQGGAIETRRSGSLDGVRVVRLDGSIADLTLASDGAIEFLIPAGEPYRLSVPTARAPVEIQTAGSAPVFTEVIFGRADREPVPMGSSTVVAYDNAPLGGQFVVMSSGVWAQSGLVDTNTSKIILDWGQTFGIDGSRPALLSTEQHDLLHLGRYTTTSQAPTSTSVLEALQTSRVDLIAGDTVTIPVALSALELRSLRFTLDPSELDARLATITTMSDPSSRSWILATRASPTVSRPEFGFALNTQSSTEYRAHELDIIYPPDAFPYPAVALFAAVRTRAQEVPGEAFAVIAAITYVVPLTDDTAHDFVGAPIVSPPTMIELDGVPITVDDMIVVNVDDTRDATVSWPAAEASGIAPAPPGQRMPPTRVIGDPRFCSSRPVNEKT